MTGSEQLLAPPVVSDAAAAAVGQTGAQLMAAFPARGVDPSWPSTCEDRSAVLARVLAAPFRLEKPDSQRIRRTGVLAVLGWLADFPGGNWQLNAAIYRAVIVRMRFHQPTIDYVARRAAEGKSKRDIIRCLKRYVIRDGLSPRQPCPKICPNRQLTTIGLTFRIHRILCRHSDGEYLRQGLSTMIRSRL